MHPGYGAITCLDSFTPPESPVPTHLLSGGEDGVVNVWQAGGEWEHLQVARHPLHRPRPRVAALPPATHPPLGDPHPRSLRMTTPAARRSP